MIEQNKVLFTGGDGLLGTEFKKQFPGAIYTGRADFDITIYSMMDTFLSRNPVSVIVHAAAFTSPPKVEQEPLRALQANIVGTCNMVKLCIKYNIKLIYISTDYVFRGDTGNYKEDDPVCPVNKYAISKLGGECAVRMYDNSLIIRTSFGPNVFPYEKAFVDQWTSRENVTAITKKMIKLINSTATGIIHIGGKRRTVFEYAKSLDKTKNIQELSINFMAFATPRDTSLDCSKYKKLIGTKKK